jgi:hypothetical protein
MKMRVLGDGRYERRRQFENRYDKLFFFANICFRECAINLKVNISRVAASGTMLADSFENLSKAATCRFVKVQLPRFRD